MAISDSILAEITTDMAPSSFARALDLARERVAGGGRRLLDIACIKHGADVSRPSEWNSFSSSGLRSISARLALAQ
jgi:hypothetical protein